MEARKYSRENFFSYNLDIPSVDYLKQYLEERGYPLQNKDLVIVIPDRNEDPEALRTTTIQLAMSNMLTDIFHQIDSDHFRIKRIVVSDQSDPKIARDNRGLLYTVKDVLLNTLKEADIPEIYHLRFDRGMSETVYDYMKDHLGMSSRERGEPILGKGINMALSSLVSSDFTEEGVSDRDTVLVFMDAENKAVNFKDPFLLGAPLVYEGSPARFSKAAFRRYHMEGESRKLGGRVNASLGVPLIHMLIHEGLIPIEKPITYPLSGEIGIDRDLFWSLRTSTKYGVETATLLQLFGRGSSNQITEKDFAQVDLGVNMDQPLAEGRSHHEVLEGVERMSNDILSATLQVMGSQIRERWDYRDFMMAFEDFQRNSMERWMESHDTRLITGGVSPEELRRTVYGVVSQGMSNYYHGERFLHAGLRRLMRILHHEDIDGFVPPIGEIREDLGDRFDEFRTMLKGHAKSIYPAE